MESVDVMIDGERLRLENVRVLSECDGYRVVSGTLPTADESGARVVYDYEAREFRLLRTTTPISDDTDLECWAEDTELE